MSDPECTVCQHTSSPHGVPPVTAPATRPGQAAEVDRHARGAYERVRAALGGDAPYGEGFDFDPRRWQAIGQYIAEQVAAQERPAPGLRGELEALADFWVREYVTDDGWPVICAKQLLDVLYGTRVSEAVASRKTALTALRSGILGLAAEYRASAKQNGQCRASEIETECAIALERLLETP